MVRRARCRRVVGGEAPLWRILEDIVDKDEKT